LNGVNYPVTVTAGTDIYTYSCDFTGQITPSATLYFYLAVDELGAKKDNSFVYFSEPENAYFLDCSSKTGCSECNDENEECGVVFFPNGTQSCAYEYDAVGIGEGEWKRDTCGKVFSKPGKYLNADGGTLVFEGGFCLSSFNGQYECIVSAGDVILQKVPLECSTETDTASCTFGEIRKGDGTIDDVSTVTLNISKKLTRDSFDDVLNGLSWEMTMVQCRTNTFDCLACTGSEFQSSVNSICRWSLDGGKCTTSEEDDAGVISLTDQCPTLSLPEDSVYIGDKTFQVSVTNLNDFDNFTLVIIGEKRNYTCNASINNTKTLDIECDELPEEETKDLKAVLVLESGVIYARSSNTMSVLKKPLSLVVIILIVAVGAILIALIIVLIAVCIHRHGGVHPFKFDVNRKPDFEQFRWATDLSGKSHAQRDKQEWEQLRELLQNPLVASAVNKATAATEADKYTSAMVYINASNGHATDFVLKLVEDEVQTIPNETQLFRGNSLASKAFRAYSRMVGLDYLWMTLSRFIHELNHLVESSKAQAGSKSNNVELDSVSSTTTTTEGVSILSTEFEVDPTKLSAGSDEETNSYMLSQRARQLLLCILNSTQYMPPELRYIAYNFAHDVHEKFPGSERIAIGGTFFLRFICPALIAPHSYALLMTPDRKKPIVPNDQLQRQLVLLGKVLQNLANGVLFGKKEPFMVRMNQFITKNIESVGKWMDEISSSNSSFKESATDVPPETLLNSYQFILTHLSNNLSKIRSNLEQAQAPPQLYASLEAHTQSAHR